MQKLIAICFLLMPLLALNQAAGLVRLELEASLNSDIYQVVPCNEFGVLVFYETKDVTENNLKNWHFNLYDKDLVQVWEANIAIAMEADFMDFSLRDSILDLFFLNIDKVKPATENFQIIHFDLAQGVSFSSRGILPGESNFVKVLFDEKTAYLALNTKNDQASVFFIDIKSASVSTFSVMYPDQNFIEDICLDTLEGRLFCLVSNFLDRRQNRLFVQALDLKGQFLYDISVSAALDSKYLNAGKLYVLPDTSFVVLGTYGSLAARIPGPNEYFGVESSGAFSTRFIHRQQTYIYYYNFLEFNNLRAGVSARDFYRLQKKKVREAPEYSLNYELLLHEPVRHDSTLIMLMEAFYPEFRTVSDISYDYWGRPVTQTYTVFDGYRIFNAILAGFNYDGELQWDNSLELNLAPASHLTMRSSNFFDGDPSLIYYNDGYRINYRVYMENTELVGFSKMDIETLRSGDRISAVGYNAMAHWFGPYFLAYGYQTIQNNLVSDRNERTVFYINKIALD